MLGFDVKDARQVLAKHAKSVHGIKSANAMWAEIPLTDEVYLAYAGQDVFLTARLAKELREHASIRGLLDLYKAERRLAARCVYLTATGMPVDKRRAEVLLHTADDVLERSDEALAAVGVTKSGKAERLSTSRDDLVRRATELKVPMTTTAKGNASLDGDYLRQQRPLLEGDAATFTDALLAAKDANSVATKVREFQTWTGKDGRLHPFFNTLQAVTGRMSVSNPALQNVPRGGDVRACLMADSGEVLIAADYAQIEFRVAAAVTKDERLRAAILEGRDIHADVAESLYGPGFTDEQRTIAKRAGFGRMYGGGVKALQEQTGVDERTASEAIAAFDKTYPGIKRFARHAAKVVDDGKITMVTTITGKPIPMPDPGHGYAAINYLIQSPARDLFVQGLDNLYAAGLGKYVRLLVHDEVVLSVPEDRAEGLAAHVADLLARDLSLEGIPITADAKVLGTHWKKG